MKATAILKHIYTKLKWMSNFDIGPLGKLLKLSTSFIAKESYTLILQLISSSSTINTISKLATLVVHR